MRQATLFVPCFVDAAAPEAAIAAVELLRSLGHRVRFPRQQTCCGQLAFNVGCRREAAALARRFCAVFADAEVIVCPSGSCAAMVRRHYAELLDGADDHGVPRRVYELCEYLVELDELEGAASPRCSGESRATRESSPPPHGREPQQDSSVGGSSMGPSLIVDLIRQRARTRTSGAPQDEKTRRVGLHIGCHLGRELGKDGPPARLLRAVPGVEIVSMESTGACCGFGGVFAVKLPEVSAAIGRRKLKEAVSLGIDYLVSTDPSCSLHLDGLAQRMGEGVPRTVYIGSLLAGMSTSTSTNTSSCSVTESASTLSPAQAAPPSPSSPVPIPSLAAAPLPPRIPSDSPFGALRGRMACLAGRTELGDKLTRATSRSEHKRIAADIRGLPGKFC
ncbi:MAG: (Fe-S)-binding protein [Pseudomonadota bacterium]